MPDLSWNLIGALAARQTASADSLVTLSLAKSDIAAILGKLQIGDVIRATVLRPQGGQDFIELAGQPLPAQLPPEVYPGETLALQVTELTPATITVRNLGPLTSTPPQTSAPQSLASQPAASSLPATPSTPQRPEIAAVQNAVKQIARTIGDLLKSVKFPDTPLTRTIAAAAPQAPMRLPQVLTRLEAALPQESADPRIATLKTLIGFTSRMNLQNESTLPAQIEAYVSHIVEGAEPKLSQLLQALSETKQQPIQQPQQQPATEPPRAQSNVADSNVTPSLPKRDSATIAFPQARHDAVTSATIPAARAAERSAAIDHDLKSVVLSLLRNPPPERTPALTQALGDAHVTLTAAQFNALSSNAQTPGTIAFSLPAFFYEGGKPAQLRISRDRDGKGQKLSADDFHVAFVLDTKNLGTVAIDLQSSGRSVKIDVKTEERRAAATFSDTLHALRARLEHLRYRVASAGAAVLERKPRTAQIAKPQDPPRTSAGLDLRA
jgi:hypothetical protein